MALLKLFRSSENLRSTANKKNDGVNEKRNNTSGGLMRRSTTFTRSKSLPRSKSNINNNTNNNTNNTNKNTAKNTTKNTNDFGKSQNKPNNAVHNHDNTKINASNSRKYQTKPNQISSKSSTPTQQGDSTKSPTVKNNARVTVSNGATNSAPRQDTLSRMNTFTTAKNILLTDIPDVLATPAHSTNGSNPKTAYLNNKDSISTRNTPRGPNATSSNLSTPNSINPLKKMPTNSSSALTDLTFSSPMDTSGTATATTTATTTTTTNNNKQNNENNNDGNNDNTISDLDTQANGNAIHRREFSADMCPLQFKMSLNKLNKHCTSMSIDTSRVLSPSLAGNGARVQDNAASPSIQHTSPTSDNSKNLRFEHISESMRPSMDFERIPSKFEKTASGTKLHVSNLDPTDRSHTNSSRNIKKIDATGNSNIYISKNNTRNISEIYKKLEDEKKALNKNYYGPGGNSQNTGVENSAGNTLLLNQNDDLILSDFNREGIFNSIFESIDRNQFIQYLENPNHIKVFKKKKIYSPLSRFILAQELKHDKQQQQQQQYQIHQRKTSSVDDPTSSISENTIWCLEFSHDGKFLASAGKDNTIRVWKVIATPLERVEMNNTCSKRDSLISSGYSSASPSRSAGYATGSSTTSCNNNNSNNNLNVNDVNLVDDIFGESTYKNNLEDDNHYGLSPDEEESNLYAPVFHPQPHRIFTGHTHDILSLDWSKNNFLLTGSMDKTVKLWHCDKKTFLKSYLHPDFVTSIKFHPKDDRFFVSGCLDHYIRMFSILEDECVYEFDVGDLITTIEISPNNGKYVYVGTFNGYVMVFLTRGLTLLFCFHIPNSKHSSEKIEIINDKLMAGANARSANQTVLVIQPGPKITGIQCFQEENDLKLLVTSNDSRIRIFSLLQRKLLEVLKGFENDSLQLKATVRLGTPNDLNSPTIVVVPSENHWIYAWKLKSSELAKLNRLKPGHSHLSELGVSATSSYTLKLRSSFQFKRNSNAFVQNTMDPGQQPPQRKKSYIKRFLDKINPMAHNNSNTNNGNKNKNVYYTKDPATARSSMDRSNLRVQNYDPNTPVFKNNDYIAFHAHHHAVTAVSIAPKAAQKVLALSNDFIYELTMLLNDEDGASSKTYKSKGNSTASDGKTTSVLRGVFSSINEGMIVVSGDCKGNIRVFRTDISDLTRERLLYKLKIYNSHHSLARAPSVYSKNNAVINSASGNAINNIGNVGLSRNKSLNNICHRQNSFRNKRKGTNSSAEDLLANVIHIGRNGSLKKDAEHYYLTGPVGATGSSKINRSNTVKSLQSLASFNNTISDNHTTSFDTGFHGNSTINNGSANNTLFSTFLGNQKTISQQDSDYATGHISNISNALPSLSTSPSPLSGSKAQHANGTIVYSEQPQHQYGSTSTLLRSSNGHLYDNVSNIGSGISANTAVTTISTSGTAGVNNILDPHLKCNVCGGTNFKVFKPNFRSESAPVGFYCSDCGNQMNRFR
ncbi:Laf1p SCDLUD_004012 [Saccharomycodes ludwigii]|uniref:Laf1p n=1 Tax=Saccharomycodes ludwigii TaxID=36035 RepID=UPI001E8B3EB3|nr:hypothetical protein SCDLUD_004012 [Saccharomycodes ludwigii]KAH3899726.1 hypothetical protein SCDLUD_004012 [Saccharomycodes ludwigii]